MMPTCEPSAATTRTWGTRILSLILSSVVAIALLLSAAYKYKKPVRQEGRHRLRSPADADINPRPKTFSVTPNPGDSDYRLVQYSRSRGEGPSIRPLLDH